MKLDQGFSFNVTEQVPQVCEALNKRDLGEDFRSYRSTEPLVVDLNTFVSIILIISLRWNDYEIFNIM